MLKNETNSSHEKSSTFTKKKTKENRAEQKVNNSVDFKGVKSAFGQRI